MDRATAFNVRSLYEKTEFIEWMPPYRGTLLFRNKKWQSRGNLSQKSYFGLMIIHQTKNKGDLGVLKVKLDLFEQGYLIWNPETEHAPFDLVIYKDKVFKTVQVKYRKLGNRGSLEIFFRSNYCNSHGAVSKNVDKSLIDIYTVYCPDTDCCYYFNPQDFCKSIALRVKAPLNNQQQGIHFADDFRKVP